MRLIQKHKYGNEIILAQEKWFTLSEMNFEDISLGTEYNSDNYDNAFYIDKGVAEFTIYGTTMEWGYGKTVLIKRTKKWN